MCGHCYHELQLFFSWLSYLGHVDVDDQFPEGGKGKEETQKKNIIIYSEPPTVISPLFFRWRAGDSIHYTY